MIRPNKQPKITIAGLGNLLMSDDGVGVHAVRVLQEDAPQDVTIADVGTAPLHAQQLFADSDLVIAIDAVENGGKAGEVYVFNLNELDNPPCNSLHDLGLAGVLKLMPENQRPHVIVVGVEPAKIDYGMELSPPVEKAMSLVLKTVRQLVEGKMSCRLAK